MNNLLIFFAFPIAVIILSIIVNKALRNPIAVAALVFAIFVVVTFAAFDETFLIATLAYTILAFITALLSNRFLNCNNNSCNLCNRNTDCNTCLCNALMESLENNNNSTNNVIDGLLDLLQNNNNNSNDNNTCDANVVSESSVPNDDNVINNNCSNIYNKRCRRF